MKFKDWVTKATRITGSALLAHKLATATLDIVSHTLQELTPHQLRLLDLSLKRYLSCEPLTRIRGKTLFFGNWFDITPAVLDPRPETELLVMHAIAHNPKRVLELGTGSGCVICSVLSHTNPEYALATDISPDALYVAEQNARNLKVKCEFRLSDWCEKITETFDLVISNPPYVASTEKLPKSVWAYDPAIALYSGQNGCDAHTIALPQVRLVLEPGGTLLWEIGYDQGEWIRAYATTLFPDSNVEILQDFNGLDRVLKVSGYKKQPTLIKTA